MLRDGLTTNLNFTKYGKPKVILSKNIKGKGVSFLEGHGSWHHKIPTKEELELIKEELNK